MKISERLKSDTTRHALEATLIIVTLIILPMLGDCLGKNVAAILMFVISVFGSLALFLLYRERSNWRQIAMVAALAGVIGAVVSLLALRLL